MFGSVRSTAARGRGLVQALAKGRAALLALAATVLTLAGAGAAEAACSVDWTVTTGTSNNRYDFTAANYADCDPSNLGLVAASVTTAQGGTLSVRNDLTGGMRFNGAADDDGFLYTPPVGFTGTDTAGFTGRDAGGAPVAGTLTITVRAAAPTAAGFTYGSTVPYARFTNGSTASIDLSAHATGAPTSYTLGSVTSAAGGSLTVNNAGVVTYRPVAGFRGNDTFTWRATNATGSSAYATVTVPVGDPTFAVSIWPSFPTAGVAVQAGASATMSGGKAPYSDFAVTGLPAGLTMSSTGALTGTATTPGSYTVTVTATDSSTGAGPVRASATSPMTVYGAPTASSFTAPSEGIYYVPTTGYTANIDVWSHVVGSPTAFQLGSATSAAGGAISIHSTNGRITYTIPAGFRGTDTFTYRAGNAAGWSGYATVTVEVPDPTIQVSLPADYGAVGVPYAPGNSGQVFAQGGRAPYGNYSATGLPPGLSLSSSGVLSGTPTMAGEYLADITVTDSSLGAGPFTATTQRLIRVADSELAVAFNGGGSTVRRGSNHQIALNVNNAGAAAANGVTAEITLPTGVLFVSAYGFDWTCSTPPAFTSGTITCTANIGANRLRQVVVDVHIDRNAATASTVSAVVTHNGQTFNASQVLNVETELLITPPSGTVGVPGSGGFSAGNGTAPYTFSISSGSLPPGLSLAADGSVSGTPSAGGVFNLDVTVTDSGPAPGPYSTTKSVDWYIGAPSWNLTTTTLAAGTVGAPYSAAFNLSGAATAPYTFAVIDGALPAGLTLSSDGTLSGTPTAGGAFSFTVKVTDSSTGEGPYVRQRPYTLTIAAPTPALPASVPAATQGVSYNEPLAVTGGTAPYAYAITAGALPMGVGLTPDGVLSGRPVQSGTFNFTVGVTDSSSGSGPYATSQAYSLNVAASAPTISGVSPSSGPVAGGGTVVITGTNLAETSAVSFNGTPASSFTVHSATQISAVVPAGSAGAVPVAVLTPAGSVMQPNAYTYVVDAPVASHYAYPTPIAYNAGSGAPTGFSLAGQATNTPTSFAVTSSTTAQGATVGIDAAGAVSYLPPVGFRGSDSFQYNATNAGGTSADATVTLTVGDPTLVMGAALPNGATGATYNSQAVLSGGKGPYSSFSASGLPTGLSMDASGLITGAPTQAGTFDVTVTATDSSTGTGPYTGSVQTSLTVLASPDLQAAWLGGSSSVVAGASANLNFGVNNVGTGQAASVTAQIALPSETTFNSLTSPMGWSCTTPAVGAGGSVTCTAAVVSAGAFEAFSLNVRVAPTAAAGTKSVTLNVTSDTETETATGTLTVLAPDMQAALTGPASVVRGQTATLTLTMTNAGNAQTPHASWQSTLPAGLTFTSLSAPGGWMCSTPAVGAGGHLSCGEPAGIPAGASRVFTLVVGVDGAATSPTTVNVMALTSFESEYPSASFDVVDAVPTLTAVDAPRGPSAGGINVVLRGDNLAGATAVTWGASSIPFIVISNSQIQVTTPAGTAGASVDVTVTTPGGTSAPVRFDYVDRPTVVGLTPSAGPVAGGTNVVIQGTNLAAASEVTLNGASVPFVMISDNALQITTPAHASGSFQIQVTVPYIGTSLTGGGSTYTYVDPPVATGFTAAAVGYNTGGAAASDIRLVDHVTNAPTLFQVDTAGTQGTVVVDTATGVAAYTPAPGFRGTDSFKFWAAGPGGTTETVTVLVPVVDPSFVVSLSAPLGRVGEAYSGSATVSGGFGPYAGLSAAGLPAGLSMDATGAISGTPTQAGSFEITVTATDSSIGDGPFTGTATTILFVMPPALALTPGALGDGTVGVAYTGSVSASGGTAPYAYTIAGGDLPVGVEMAADGSFSGTPTAGGTFNFTVKATDSSTGTAFSVSKAYTLTVAAPTVAVGPAGLPNARQTFAYSQALSATGGTPGHSFAVVGALPAGLSLSPAGVLSGTPTQSGVFDFTVTATDSSTGSGPYTGSRAYSLTVDVPPAPAGSDRPGVVVPYASAGTAIDLSGAVTGLATSISVATPPAHGTVSVSGFVVTYTPASGWFGPDSFSYTVTGPGGTSAPATVSLMVTTPAAPTASDRTGVAVPYAGAGTAIDLSGSVSGVYATLAIGTAPAHGTVSVSGAVVTYTPAAGYFGADSFTYTATGPGGTSAPATVSVTVGVPPAPTAADASLGVGFASSQAIDLSAYVSGVYTTVAIAAEPGHGSVEMDGTTATYTPAADWFGADSFTFTATGPGGTSAPATVSVTVATPPPPAPAPHPETAPVVAGAHTDIQIVNTGGQVDDVQITTPPTHGTVEVVRALRPAAVRAAADEPVFTLTYRPNAGFVGTDTFAYALVGPGGTSAPATVQLTVLPAVTVAPIEVTTLQGVAVEVDLTAEATGGPFTGAAVVSVGPSGAGQASIAQVGSARILTFDPADDFTGAAVVTFTLSNAQGTSQPSTVTVTVEARPDPALDGDVRGLIGAQAQAAQRFVDTQVSNFSQRAEALHGEGDREGPRPHAMGLSFGLGDYGARAIDPAAELRSREMPEQPFRDHVLRQEMLAAIGDAPQAAGSGVDGLGPVGGGRIALWSAGSIDFGQRHAEAGGARLEFTTSGVSLGADVELAEGLFVGVGAGYGYDATEIGTEGTRNASRAYMGAVYGSWRVAPELYVDAVAGLGTLSFDSRRVAANDAIVVGKRDGSQAFGSLSLAWDRERGNFTLSPYGRLTVSKAELDAFTETGDPVFALAYDAQDVDALSGTLGVRGQWDLALEDGSFSPRFRAEWRRQFQGTGSAAVRYADFLTGPSYQVDPLQQDRNALLLGFGGDWRWDEGLFLSLDYEGAVADEALSHRVVLKVQTRF